MWEQRRINNIFIFTGLIRYLSSKNFKYSSNNLSRASSFKPNRRFSWIISQILQYTANQLILMSQFLFNLIEGNCEIEMLSWVHIKLGDYLIRKQAAK